jgi:flagellin-like protein
MRVRNLATDDEAVSSVIAVVLMVALTIVLAASVGVFVLGIGEEATGQVETPTTKFATEYASESGPHNDTLTVTVQGGSTVEAENLEVIVEGTTLWEAGATGSGNVIEGTNTNWDGAVKGGNSLILEEDGGNAFEGGDRLMIVWRCEESSTVLLDRQI